MLGLFIYMIMVLLPILIPLGLTIVHTFGEWRKGVGLRPSAA